MKLFVPSIGSMTQFLPLGFLVSKVIDAPVSDSSPMIPSSGKPLFQSRDDQALRRAIGVGDGFFIGRHVGLGQAFNLAIIFQDDFPRAACQFDGVLEVVFDHRQQDMRFIQPRNE